MSVTTLERAILNELRQTLKNRKIKVEDILEWSTSEEAIDKNLREGELKLKMTFTGTWVAVKKELDNREMAA